jgi:hypothetical protein
MVEGARLGAACDDSGDYSLHVRQHFAGWNAKHRKPGAPKLLVPLQVELRLVAAVVGLAIDLDREARAEAGEIDGETQLRKLLPELVPARALLQLAP